MKIQIKTLFLLSLNRSTRGPCSAMLYCFAVSNDKILWSILVRRLHCNWLVGWHHKQKEAPNCCNCLYTTIDCRFVDRLQIDRSSTESRDEINQRVVLLARRVVGFFGLESKRIWRKIPTSGSWTFQRKPRGMFHFICETSLAFRAALQQPFLFKKGIGPTIGDILCLVLFFSSEKSIERIVIEASQDHTKMHLGHTILSQKLLDLYRYIYKYIIVD